jgi:Sec-independent protein translocase protein TatA
MEILNIGPLELIIILVFMFIILGPKDMVKTAQRIGGWVRSVTRSPMWREVWGISQDIRELPKKLMEETGLEEALTDVKQTTQDVAKELNAQINEAKEAARVPEVEHLRVDTNPLIGPPPGSVPAALPSTVASTNNLEAIAIASLETAAQSTGAVSLQPVEVAEQAVVETAVAPTAEELPAPVKKTRRKKQVAVESAPVDAPVVSVRDPLAEPDEPAFPSSWGIELPPMDFQPAAAPSNGHASNTDMADAAVSGETTPAPTPRPRKRRVSPSAESAQPVESASVEEASPSDGSNGNGTEKPARVRKPRQPRLKASPETNASTETAVSTEIVVSIETAAPQEAAAPTEAAPTEAAPIEAAPTAAALSEAAASEPDSIEVVTDAATVEETVKPAETAEPVLAVAQPAEEIQAAEQESQPEQRATEISGQDPQNEPDVQPDSNIA